MSETTGFEEFIRGVAARSAHLAHSPLAQHMSRVAGEEAKEREAEAKRKADAADQAEVEMWSAARAGRLPTLSSLLAEAYAMRSDNDPGELEREAQRAEAHAAHVAYVATHPGRTLAQVFAQAALTSDAAADAADARAKADRAREWAQRADTARQTRREAEQAEAQRSSGNLLTNPAAQIGIQSALR